ncbi:PH domain-containing protein [uncultured Amnibacterium sp.]|uniref:PH domain-containing protein n=1 Tax=uncultured Amnibacterium sp. TaxID=1631851 RepID=UPI0035CBA3C1
MTVLPPRALDAGITGWRGVSNKLVWVDVAAILMSAIGGAVVGVLLLWLIQPAPWIGWLVIAAVAVSAVVRLVIAPRRVHAIGWILRDDDLVVRRGILLSRLVAVPYGRMQLIDVNRGPVARLVGLAELRLVTAAATSDVALPGLPEAEAAQLRDALVARAEERRVGL